jgi:hypothetical protein
MKRKKISSSELTLDVNLGRIDNGGGGGHLCSRLSFLLICLAVVSMPKFACLWRMSDIRDFLFVAIIISICWCLVFNFLNARSIVVNFGNNIDDDNLGTVCTFGNIATVHSSHVTFQFLRQYPTKAQRTQRFKLTKILTNFFLSTNGHKLSLKKFVNNS